MSDLGKLKKYKPKIIKTSISENLPKVEWQHICQSLSKDYKLPRLRELAEEFNLSTENKTKRQLCVEISKIIDSTCTNKENLNFEVISSNEPDTYVLEEDNHKFCFNKSDYDGYLKDKKKNPYTRKQIPENQMAEMKIMFEKEQNENHEYSYDDNPDNYNFDRDSAIADWKLMYAYYYPSVIVNNVFSPIKLIQNTFSILTNINVPENIVQNLLDFRKNNKHRKRLFHKIQDEIPVYPRMGYNRGADETEFEILYMIEFCDYFIENKDRINSYFIRNEIPITQDSMLVLNYLYNWRTNGIARNDISVNIFMHEFIEFITDEDKGLGENTKIFILSLPPDFLFKLYKNTF